jgi:Tfp pilus assembly protein PilO
MYFLPRAPNKLYARAAHVSSAYRYGVTLCLFGVTIAAWFTLIYRPVEASLGAYTLLNNSLRDECKLGASCQKSVRDLTQEVDQLRTMLDADASTIGRCIDWISPVITSAQEGGLTIRAYTAGKEATKEWYCTAQAQFEVMGRYEQLLNFLHTVQRINPRIGCKQWSITRVHTDHYTMLCTLYIFQPTQKI